MMKTESVLEKAGIVESYFGESTQKRGGGAWNEPLKKPSRLFLLFVCVFLVPSCGQNEAEWAGEITE
jgi:hypothetical protein